jgi:hypothetical protein
MTMQHLDTVIAFAFVMLGASLVIVAGTQVAISLLGLRGTNLRRSLADLFESTSADRDAKRYSREIARRVLSHPVISDSIFSRFCIRTDDLPFLPADAAGKLQWAASGIPFRSWLFGALGGFFLWPAALATIKYLSLLDVCTYSDIVAAYVPVLNFCEHPWRSGAIAGAIFGWLLSRWRLATSIRPEELVATLERLSEPQHGTLPDPAQRAMLVLAGQAQSEAQTEARPRVKAVSPQVEEFSHDTLDFDGGGVAVAVEKAVATTPTRTEPRPYGLKSSFDDAMDRASQRFTMQARVVTVLLSLVFVFAAHLDAIRLFQTLSSSAQLRAGLAGSADAMIKQAEQMPRTRDGVRTVVPDVYRKSMAVVLQPVLANTESARSKPRAASRKASASTSSTQPQPDGGGPAAPNENQDSTSNLLLTSATVQTSQESPAKSEVVKDVTPAKRKTSAKDREKSAAAPAPVSIEDKATAEAKTRAAKALQARPGFASREDAVSWLHTTLEDDPALENLAAMYEQEVNTELVSDSDKLIDHSASLKRGLTRSEFQLLPENWHGWKPTKHELPGLLVAVAFLSLGAAFLYNMLKNITSLRPMRVHGRS